MMSLRSSISPTMKASMGLPMKLISRTAGGHYWPLHIARRNQNGRCSGVPILIGTVASPTHELLFPSDRDILSVQRWCHTSLALFM